MYPLTEEQVRAQLQGYLASGDWRVLHDEEPLIILQRRQAPPLPARRYFARRSTGGTDTTRFELQP
jgi:hypothetical protein